MVTTSTKFTATVGGVSANVYGKSRLMEANEVVPTEVWGHGDTIEQSWLIIKGSTSSDVVLSLISGTISSYNIYPENIATSVAINGGNLEFTVPSSAKLRVEINGDRAECFHVFAGPATPRSSTDPDLTDWSTLVKPVQSIDHTTNTVNCNAHGFSNGDQVHLYSTGDLPTVANPGSLTNGPSALFAQGPILSHSPAWVANATTNSFTLVHRDLTTAVDFLDNGTGTFSVSPGQYTDTGNALYFPSGSEYHMGMQMDLATNTEVFIDEDAIVHGSFNLQDADNVVIHGGGMLTGGYRQRKELDSGTAFTQCVEHTLFIGDFHGGQTNGYPANKNSGNGAFDNEVKDITVVDNAFYINNKGVWSWRDVSYINIWSYNADGFRTAPKTLTDPRGQIIDCFTFASDDCCKFQLDNKHQLLDNVFAVAAANGCFQGYSWPTEKAEGYSAMIQNCHAMHLMGPDTGGDPYDPATVFPAYGTRHIIRSYTDGYLSEQDYGHSDVTFRNLNVWGPCEVRFLSAGNNPYPFGESQVREQRGVMRNWTFENITIQNAPTVIADSKSRVHALDSTSRPTNWLFTDITIGGVAITSANKDTYFEIDALCKDFRFETGVVRRTVGYWRGGYMGDYEYISDWLTDRKNPTPSRSLDDVEELILLPYFDKAGTNQTHDIKPPATRDSDGSAVTESSWANGWYAGNAKTTVTIKANDNHDGDWTKIGLTSSATGFNGSYSIGIVNNNLVLSIEDLILETTTHPILRINGGDAPDREVNVRRCMMDLDLSVIEAGTTSACQTIASFENCVITAPDTNGVRFFRGVYSTTVERNIVLNLRNCTFDNVFVETQKSDVASSTASMDINVDQCLISYIAPSTNSGEFVSRPGVSPFTAGNAGTVTVDYTDTLTNESALPSSAGLTTASTGSTFGVTFNDGTEPPEGRTEVSFMGATDYRLYPSYDNLAMLHMEVGGAQPGLSYDARGDYRMNGDYGAFAGDAYKITTTDALFAGTFAHLLDLDHQDNNRTRVWTFGDGQYWTAPNSFYAFAQHEYTGTGTFKTALYDGTDYSRHVPLTLAAEPAITASLTEALVLPNILYYPTVSNASNAVLSTSTGAAYSSLTTDPGPGDNAWQSPHYVVSETSAPATPLYVYSYGEKIASTLGCQIWDPGDGASDPADVAQSWVNVWADGSVTFLVRDFGNRTITDWEVYPKNVATVSYFGAFTTILQVTVPRDKKIRLALGLDGSEINRKNGLFIFNNEPLADAPTTEVLTWSDTGTDRRVHSATAAVQTAGTATRFTVPSLDLTGTNPATSSAWAVGDKFKVLLTDPTDSNYTGNQISTTAGTVWDYEPVHAEVVVLGDGGVGSSVDAVVKLIDATGTTIATCTEVELTTGGTYNISVLDFGARYGDTEVALRFPAGVHKIGRLFRVNGIRENSVTVHLDPGAMVIGSFDFRTHEAVGGLFQPTNGPIPAQNRGQGISFQGGGHISNQYISRDNLHNGYAQIAYGLFWNRKFTSDTATTLTHYSDFDAGRNFFGMFFNDAYGGFYTSNTVREVTLFAQCHHQGKGTHFSRYDRVKSMSPWYYNLDGTQIYKYSDADTNGWVRDSFFWQGDDVILISKYGTNLFIERCFLIATGNTPLNGGYWPLDEGYDPNTNTYTANSGNRYKVTINDCDILALGNGDCEVPQKDYFAFDHGTLASTTIRVGGTDWLTMESFGLCHDNLTRSYGENGNGWQFITSAATNGDPNYFDLTIQNGSGQYATTHTNLAGPNAIGTDPTNSPAQRLNYNGSASPYWSCTEDNVTVTSGTVDSETRTSSGGTFPPGSDVSNPTKGALDQLTRSAAVGGRCIFRTHTDGANGDPTNGSRSPQSSNTRAAFTDQSTWGLGKIEARNIRVWGACTHAPFAIGNIRYPFGGLGGALGQRDTRGRVDDIILANWSFEQPFAQPGYIYAYDSTNRPHNITIENWNVAGTRINANNYTQFFDVDSNVPIGGTGLTLDSGSLTDPEFYDVSWSGNTATETNLLGYSEGYTFTEGQVTNYSASLISTGMTTSLTTTASGSIAYQFSALATGTTQHGTLIGQIVTQATAATATSAGSQAILAPVMTTLATATSEDGAQNVGTSQSSLATATADDGTQNVSTPATSYNVTEDSLATATASAGAQNVGTSQSSPATATAIDGAQNVGATQSSLATATADDGAQTITILTASVTRNVLATATAHFGSAGVVQNASLTEAVLANATAILGYTLTEAGSLPWTSPLQSNRPYDKMAGVGPAPRGRNPS